MMLRLFSFLLFLLMFGTYANASIHHQLIVDIDPAASRITVKDTLTFPQQFIKANRPVEFLLHSDLILASNTDIDKLPQQKLPPHLTKYRINTLPDSGEITLSYSGSINHALKKPGEESARSFSSTLGIIDNAGVFLDGNAAWYPHIADELVSFNLKVLLPTPWLAVSAGEKTRGNTANDINTVVWDEQSPQDDIYLVAAPFTVYTQQAGNVEIQVYLRKNEASLAQQYLDTGTQYLAMYQKLLGKYPYQKFAVIENFWETGFGMPSFTLLGPRVMRFPFILHSSYPHEILHNWWGNGVFVDYESGNWAEGLTAYLADHLIAEQRGNAVGYRRNTLQKYRDYVNSGRDFALRQFRSRHDSASEAVGYGKALMLFHMLRLKLGDEMFSKALRQLYQQQKFKKTSFDDLAKVFSAAAKQDLTPFFAQWVDRSGAPSLQLGKVNFSQNKDIKRLEFELTQTQTDAPYELNIPVVVEFSDGHSDRFSLTSSNKLTRHNIDVTEQPVRISIDPEFDVFRRLDAREIPSALSQGFGASDALAVLPSAGSDQLIKSYRQLIESWQQSQNVSLQIVMDSELKHLPGNKTVWLFGWNNRFRQTVSDQILPHNGMIDDDQLIVADNRYLRSKNSVLVTSRHPDNPDQTLLWLASDNIAALPGMARKLPHYGKYSYLAFAGDEPENVGKGQWQVTNSPLVKVLTDKTLAPLQSSPRSALAELAPAFSEQRMIADIAYLANAERKGRGLGSAELDQAADYIAEEFKKAGLQTYDDDYFQEWRADIKELGNDIALKNVIGVLPGTNPLYAQQSIIISAHYDHLGTGWPDVRTGNEGKIHQGADDNASGVAIMLELARVLGKNWKPERTVIFAAFTGEEAGLLGSSHYVTNANKYPAKQAMAILNLDTVGRLGDNALSVFGAESASEWVHIFRGIGFVTGIKINTNDRAFGASDHVNFHEVGVPGVQLFSGIHLDYHRPGDTADKIDSAGLAKIASVMREALEYLSKRPEPLTSQLGPPKLPDGSQTTRQGRKVSIGTVPDFDYAGKGVRLTDVVTASPAAKAGLIAGDILTSIDGKTIADLRAYAAVLREAEVDDTLVITYLRDRESRTLSVIASKR